MSGCWGKQVNLLSYTDTASNSTKYAVVDSATGKYMEATVVITDTAAAVTVGAAEVAGAATADPLKALDAAIAKVDKFPSPSVPFQNRLDSAVTNLNNTTTNLSGAVVYSGRADYATEVSNMSKAQIIQQANAAPCCLKPTGTAASSVSVTRLMANLPVAPTAGFSARLPVTPNNPHFTH